MVILEFVQNTLFWLYVYEVSLSNTDFKKGLNRPMIPTITQCLTELDFILYSLYFFKFGMSSLSFILLLLFLPSPLCHTFL